MRGLRPRTSVDDEADVADLKVVKNSTPQCHNAPGATMPVQQHQHSNIVPHVQYLIVLAHVRRTMTPSGSSPVEQWKKKCLDWKSGSLTVFGMWSILELAGTTPNMGAEPKIREEERWRIGERRGESF
jgi:hypothetical protein